MIAAEGILTVRGGMTSHAAVVARGMGTCCVAGCGELKVNEEARTLEVNGQVLTFDDYISIDGSTGHIYMLNKLRQYLLKSQDISLHLWDGLMK